MRQIIACFIVCVALLAACDPAGPVSPPPPPPPPDYVVGENYYTTTVDSDEREYYVHVPEAYSGGSPVPVVFFMHGGSGTGLTSYNSSGWKEVGEEDNFLTVFPTSWSYCWIRANGSSEDTTRWNSLPGIFEFCPGEVPRDDVKFLRQVVDDLHGIFNVDAQRIYMAGLSSGGQMGFRCAVEMSDLLAAVVQVAGTHQKDTMLTPLRNPPIAFEVGNIDNTWFDEPFYPPLALFDTLLQTSTLLRQVVEAHARTFQYDTTYVLSGDDQTMTATFPSRPGGEAREFRFTLVDSLAHDYPNTANHPIHGARVHWEWMRQFTLQ